MGEDGGSGGGGGDAGGLTHLPPGARSHSETHPHEPVPGDTRVVHAGTRNIQHPVTIQLSATGGTVLIRGLHTYTSYTYITLLAYLRAAA